MLRMSLMLVAMVATQGLSLGFAEPVTPDGGGKVVLAPVILWLKSGNVYDCGESQTTEEGLHVCSLHPPLVLFHPDPSTDHATNAWTKTVTNADGSVEKSCGEWHAESAGQTANQCTRVFASGAFKDVSYLVIYRCKTNTPGGGCDASHYTTGLVKSFLRISQSSWQFWNVFNNGVELGQCNGITEGVHRGTETTAYIQGESGCPNGLPKGLWGGGAAYWPNS